MNFGDMLWQTLLISVLMVCAFQVGTVFPRTQTTQTNQYEVLCRKNNVVTIKADLMIKGKLTDFYFPTKYFGDLADHCQVNLMPQKDMVMKGSSKVTRAN